MIKQML